MTDMESHHPSSYRKPFKADAAAFGTGGAELTDEIDFDAMDERLGGEPAAPAESHVAQTGDSAEMVNMLDWLDGPEARVYFGRSFSLELLALSWVFNPGKFEGKSLSEVAKERGVTVQCLSKYTSEVSRIYGERNASQKAHGKRWSNNFNAGVEGSHINEGNDFYERTRRPRRTTNAINGPGPKPGPGPGPG